MTQDPKDAAMREAVKNCLTHWNTPEVWSKLRAVMAADERVIALVLQAQKEKP